MLTACAAKAYHQISETTLHITLNRGIYQFVGMAKECENFTIIFKILNYWRVETCIRFVTIIFARIV